MKHDESHQLLEQISATKQRLWQLQQQALESEFAGLTGQAILCQYAHNQYIAIDTRNVRMVAQSMQFDGASDQRNALGTIMIDDKSITVYDLSAILQSAPQTVDADGYIVVLRHVPEFGLYLSDILDVEQFDPAALEYEMQGDGVAAFAQFSVGQAFLYNPLSILVANAQ